MKFAVQVTMVAFCAVLAVSCSKMDDFGNSSLNGEYESAKGQKGTTVSYEVDSKGNPVIITVIAKCGDVETDRKPVEINWSLSANPTIWWLQTDISGNPAESTSNNTKTFSWGSNQVIAGWESKNVTVMGCKDTTVTVGNNNATMLGWVDTFLKDTLVGNTTYTKVNRQFNVKFNGVIPQFDFNKSVNVIVYVKGYTKKITGWDIAAKSLDCGSKVLSVRVNFFWSDGSTTDSTFTRTVNYGWTADSFSNVIVSGSTLGSYTAVENGQGFKVNFSNGLSVNVPGSYDLVNYNGKNLLNKPTVVAASGNATKTGNQTTISGVIYDVYSVNGTIKIDFNGCIVTVPFQGSELVKADKPYKTGWEFISASLNCSSKEVTVFGRNVYSDGSKKDTTFTLASNWNFTSTNFNDVVVSSANLGTATIVVKGQGFTVNFANDLTQNISGSYDLVNYNGQNLLQAPTATVAQANAAKTGNTTFRSGKLYDIYNVTVVTNVNFNGCITPVTSTGTMLVETQVNTNIKYELAAPAVTFQGAGNKMVAHEITAFILNDSNNKGGIGFNHDGTQVSTFYNWSDLAYSYDDLKNMSEKVVGVYSNGQYVPCFMRHGGSGTDKHTYWVSIRKSDNGATVATIMDGMAQTAGTKVEDMIFTVDGYTFNANGDVTVNFHYINNGKTVNSSAKYDNRAF